MYIDFSKINTITPGTEHLDEMLSARVEAQLWHLGLLTELQYHSAVDGYLQKIPQTATEQPDDQAYGTYSGDAFWLNIAKAELGEREYSSGSNPRIVEYTKTVGYSNDDTPWCSAFAVWVMQKAGFKTNGVSAASRSWLNWGRQVEPFTIGSIVVFYRGPGQGHVGFCVGKGSKGGVSVLGGNQSNAVTINKNDMRPILGWRWPSESGGKP